MENYENKTKTIQKNITGDLQKTLSDQRESIKNETPNHTTVLLCEQNEVGVLLLKVEKINQAREIK